jgi:uncharacterized protein (TIGR02145 family)
MQNKWITGILLILIGCNNDPANPASNNNTVTDIDGNVYSTVNIGDQVWMADNLKVTKYRNGDTLPGISNAEEWKNLSAGAYCYYNNDTNNIAAYGRLYNWYAVSDNRNIAPEGWHIPTEEEIIALTDFLAGDTIAAGKMKDTGSRYWINPNTGATNESGFSARPGGYRFDDGRYYTLRSNGYWWSATRSYEMYAWTPRLYFGFADVKREPYYEKYGFAVRCIKDRERKAKEEQVVEGFDHSLNRINKAHYHFPYINGDGLTVSVKEDLFDIDDIDFRNRYLPVSLASEKTSGHANMVATLIAGGGNTFYTGRGVAWGSMISSSSFDNLMPDPDAFFTSNNITVQNHSYGVDIENFYGADAAAYDGNMFRQPGMVHVFSSGNSGASASNTGTYKDIIGFANLTGSFKMAKNNIVVSAIDSFSSSIEYISAGPAYDGRLKPELSACTNGGSSGAAALVSGSALLVQQQYKQKYNNLPDASLVKAVLINSADDAGPGGIDFKTGFGSLNLYKTLLSVEQGRFFSGVVANNGSQSFTITIPGNVKQLKATLVWTDPPALANSAAALVNDLDMTLIHQGGQQWLPWVLNSFPHRDSLLLPAVRKRDRINNTEQVTIDDPATGNYEIRVQGYNVLANQQFHVAWQYEKSDTFSWDYPVAMDNLLPSANNIIRWQNSFEESGMLQWTADGLHWETIQSQADLSKNYALWAIPDTISTARLRMVIGQQVFLSDTFTISKPVSFEVSFNCRDSVQLRWTGQKSISFWRLYTLDHKYLKSLAVTADTVISLSAASLSSVWFSIAPVLSQGREGIKSVAMPYDDRRGSCLGADEYLVYPNPVWRNQPVTIASSAGENEVFQLYTIDGRMVLQQSLRGTYSTVNLGSMPAGIYLYLIFNKGVRKYAGRLIVK